MMPRRMLCIEFVFPRLAQRTHGLRTCSLMKSKSVSLIKWPESRSGSEIVAAKGSI